jgi:hypothetical protein
MIPEGGHSMNGIKRFVLMVVVCVIGQLIASAIGDRRHR